MNNLNGNEKLINQNSLVYSINQPASVYYAMGSGVPGNYDNIRFIANPYDGWKAAPANAPLLPNKLYVPMGTPLPLKNEEVAMELPADSMFVFGRNQASPNCKGSFSTSTGQVCTTPEQRDYIGVYRGGNKTYPTEF